MEKKLKKENLFLPPSFCDQTWAAQHCHLVVLGLNSPPSGSASLDSHHHAAQTLCRTSVQAGTAGDTQITWPLVRLVSVGTTRNCVYELRPEMGLSQETLMLCLVGE